MESAFAEHQREYTLTFATSAHIAMSRELVESILCGYAEELRSIADDSQGICAHILDGAPLTLKKTNKAEKTFKASDASKKRRVSDGTCFSYKQMFQTA
jgi:hypothetical protein